MRIDFEFETEPDYGEGWNAVLRSRRHVAKITFKVGPYTVIYIGQSYNEEFAAALGAVQAFLDGDVYHRGVDSEITRDNGTIEFGPMSAEIKTIIEQAIDLKTGKNRGKLLAYFSYHE